MNRDDFKTKVREFVIRYCEARGGKLQSRQTEAVIDTFTDLFFAMGDEVDAMEQRILALEMDAAGELH